MEKEGRGVSIRVMQYEKDWLSIADFDNERGPWGKEWKQLQKSCKETDSPLEPLEEHSPAKHLHFSLVKLILDFWFPEL